MPSTFFGISISQSALTAQKQAMDVLGYNIAHANDPTYKRQRVVMQEGAVLAQAQDASAVSNSPFGSGVSSGGIERIRDTLIENRLRQSLTTLAEWDYKSSSMSNIEAILSEPSDGGLQETLDEFWNSWQSVATTPDSEPLRASLLENSTALCERIQFVYGEMINATQDLNFAVGDSVDQINLMADEIGRLNSQIGALDAGEMPVNDLLNRRDALVQELSKLVDIGQYGDDKSDYIISVGGRILVQGALVNEIKSDVKPDGTRTLQWANDGQDVVAQGGKLKAILDMRDDVIPDYMSQLDNLAETLVEDVNAIHSTGKTLTGADAGNFFKEGSTAGNIALDDSIIGQPKLIAASSDGAVSNNDIAKKIYGLEGTPGSSLVTINTMYQNLIGDIASTASIADKQNTAYQLAVNQLTTQQQAVSGVSLDEEMSNMIRFQQAYNAASRILTAADEMLDVLVEKTGTVGR